MQALQCLFHAPLPVPGVIGFDLCLQGVQIQVVRTRQVLIAHCNHMCQAVGRCVKDRCFRVQIGFLRHIGNADALLKVPRPIVGLCHSAQNFEQGGFAGAIAPDQAHPLPRFQRKSSVVQQGHMPEG